VETRGARGNIRRSKEHAEDKAEGDGSELEVFLPRRQKPTSIKCSSHELSSWKHAALVGTYGARGNTRFTNHDYFLFLYFHFVLIQSGAKIKAVSSFLEALNFNPISIQTPYGQTMDFDCGFSV
jgi:hypothetical protein